MAASEDSCSKWSRNEKFRLKFKDFEKLKNHSIEPNLLESIRHKFCNQSSDSPNSRILVSRYENVKIGNRIRFLTETSGSEFEVVADVQLFIPKIGSEIKCVVKRVKEDFIFFIYDDLYTGFILQEDYGLQYDESIKLKDSIIYVTIKDLNFFEHTVSIQGILAK
ncbi:MAG: hypothetical protein MHMPM18_002832 [Marteilia pararefringens]